MILVVQRALPGLLNWYTSIFELELKRVDWLFCSFVDLFLDNVWPVTSPVRVAHFSRSRGNCVLVNEIIHSRRSEQSGCEFICFHSNHSTHDELFSARLLSDGDIQVYAVFRINKKPTLHHSRHNYGPLLRRIPYVTYNDCGVEKKGKRYIRRGRGTF